MKDEIKNIIKGAFKVKQSDLIQTVAHFLEKSNSSGSKAQKTKSFKKEETDRLIEFIELNSLWYKDTEIKGRYIGEGVEQEVYLNKNGQTVVKFNTSIYYASWLDYFKNLLLHNLLFPGTQYKFLGFKKTGASILAVVEQPYIVSTETTDLKGVKEFLLQNGFVNKKNHDYYNASFNIILEDMHDENVLTNNGILFFIDTVFFIKE